MKICEKVKVIIFISFFFFLFFLHSFFPQAFMGHSNKILCFCSAKNLLFDMGIYYYYRFANNRAPIFGHCTQDFLRSYLSLFATVLTFFQKQHSVSLHRLLFQQNSKFSYFIVIIFGQNLKEMMWAVTRNIKNYWSSLTWY